MYWESDNLGEPEKILIIKDETLDGVIQFCKMKGLKSYCIFDDMGLNVCNDGKLVVQPKGIRELVKRLKEKENEKT